MFLIQWIKLPSTIKTVYEKQTKTNVDIVYKIAGLSLRLFHLILSEVA